MEYLNRRNYGAGDALEYLNPRNYRAGDALEYLNPRNYRAVASPTTRRDPDATRPLRPRALRIPERQTLRLPTFRRSEVWVTLIAVG